MENDTHVGLKGSVVILPIMAVSMWIAFLVTDELIAALGDGWFQGWLYVAVIIGGGVIGGFASGFWVAAKVWGW